MRTRVFLACLIGLACSSAILVNTGCTVMGGSAEKAMSMLPESVKTTVSNYLGGLTDVNALLGNVNNLASAQAALPKLVTAVNKIGDATSVLNGLDGSTRSTALKAFEPQLSQAHAAFTDQLARINSNKSLSSVLGSALEQIQLFK